MREIRLRGQECYEGKVRRYLKGSKFSKRWQARIFQACIEVSLLYDCQAIISVAQERCKLQR